MHNIVLHFLFSFNCLLLDTVWNRCCPQRFWRDMVSGSGVTHRMAVQSLSLAMASAATAASTLRTAASTLHALLLWMVGAVPWQCFQWLQPCGFVQLLLAMLAQGYACMPNTHAAWQAVQARASAIKALIKKHHVLLMLCGCNACSPSCFGDVWQHWLQAKLANSTIGAVQPAHLHIMLIIMCRLACMPVALC